MTMIINHRTNSGRRAILRALLWFVARYTPKKHMDNMLTIFGVTPIKVAMKTNRLVMLAKKKAQRMISMLLNAATLFIYS